MREALADHLAEREGTEAAVLVHSDRLALACTLLAVLQPGDHLLVSRWLRPATWEVFANEAVRLGYDVQFIDPLETRSWRQALRPTTRLLFVEAPVLATTRLVDLRPLHALSQEAGLAFMIDATGASPAGFSPVAHGADLVLHDAAGLLDPEGDGAVGVVCGAESVVEEITARRDALGAAPHPLAVARLERGLATLDLRVARQAASAAWLAEATPSLPRVRSVYYPGSPTHPDQAVAHGLLPHGGTRLLLEFDDEDAVDRLCTMFPAPGEAPGTDTTMAPVPGAAQVTLAVGLEPVEALLASIARALA
jgi:cystathionine beta-lyase/cystathionine gamma-synthase